MKKFFAITFILSTLLFLSGCSSTWNGIKEDSSNAWNKTKKSINEATAD